MSEKSKKLKKMQREFLKIKRQYELEHKEVRKVLCDDCSKVDACRRTKGQKSCVLYVKGVEVNELDISSDTCVSSDPNSASA